MSEDEKAHHVDVHVGQQIRTYRTLRGLTQTDLAKSADVSFQQIQKYELGRNRVSCSKLFQISQALEVPISTFFEGKGDGQEQQEAFDAHTMKLVEALLRITDKGLRTKILSFVETIALTEGK